MPRSLAIAGLLLFHIGCGQQGSRTAEDSPEPPALNITLPDPSSDAAESENALSAVTGTPSQAVEEFLAALRKGDDQTTAALLTDKARQETAKHNLVVQPPGTPSAKFIIGEAEFIDADQSGAHVNSVWTEGDDAEDVVTYEIVWAVRRQPHGWRIAGMATEIIAGEPPVFLNFEDPGDMLRKWNQAEEIAAKYERTNHQAQPSSYHAEPPTGTTLRR